MDNAMNYIINKKIHMESNYPYTATNSPCVSPAGFKFWEKSKTNIVPALNMKVFLQNLALRPISVAFNVKSHFFLYTSGIYDPASDPSCSVGLNHGVLAVGYSLGCKPFIKFKNSWGITFGEAGYFRMKLAKVIAQSGPCNLIGHTRNVYPSI